MTLEDTVAAKKHELREIAEVAYFDQWTSGDEQGAPLFEMTYFTFEFLIQVRQALVQIKAGNAAGITIPTLPQNIVDNVVAGRAVVDKLRTKLRAVNAARDANDEAAVQAVMW